MSIERKIKPFRLPDEESITMLEAYGADKCPGRETIFKLEDIVTIYLDDPELGTFEVSLIDGTNMYLKYDKIDNQCLSYEELKTLWFKHLAIEKKEKIINEQRFETISMLLKNLNYKIKFNK